MRKWMFLIALNILFFAGCSDEPKSTEFSSGTIRKTDNNKFYPTSKITDSYVKRIGYLISTKSDLKTFYSENKGDRTRSLSGRIKRIDPANSVVKLDVATVIYTETIKDTKDVPLPPHLTLSINCENERKMGKDCLTSGDKDSMAIIESMYLALNLKEPSLNLFTDFLRNCIAKRCKEENVALNVNKENRPEYLMNISVPKLAPVPDYIHIELYDYQDKLKNEKALGLMK